MLLQPPSPLPPSSLQPYECGLLGKVPFGAGLLVGDTDENVLEEVLVLALLEKDAEEIEVEEEEE